MMFVCESNKLRFGFRNEYQMETQSFFVDDWLVEPETGQVTNRLRTVRLEPQVMKVLVHLASNSGDVVTKQEIIDALWQRRHTSDAALARCIFTIRRAFGDDRKQPRFIKTIPKIGYKMVAQISKSETPVARRKSKILAAAAAAVVLAVGALALSFTGAQSTLKISDTVVETVGVGEDALFLHSLANVLNVKLREEIAAAGVRVISSENTAGEMRVKEFSGSNQLDSRILVAGSKISIVVTKSNDSESGGSWQRRFFMDTSGELDTVSGIVQEVLGAMNLRASSAGSDNRQVPTTPNIVAYDFYLQGVQKFQEFTIGGNLAAIALFESALDHDPNYGLAYAGLSAALTMQVRHWHGTRRSDALSAAVQAIEREPDRAESHYALGEVLSIDLAKSERALESFAKALVIDPDHIEALRSSGSLYQLDGDFEKAKEYYDRALELMPGDHYTMRMLGSTYFEMGDFDSAHHWLVKSYKGVPFSVKANSQLAMLDLMSGDTNNAISRCDRLVRLTLSSYSCMRVAAAASIVAGDMTDARSRFNAMSKLWPNDGYVRLGQAYVLLSDRSNEQAQRIIDSVLEQANESIDTNSDSANTLRIVAIAHALQGHIPKAYEILENAAKKGRSYDPWDEVDPLLAVLRRDHRFDLYIAAVKPSYR